MGPGMVMGSSARRRTRRLFRTDWNREWWDPDEPPLSPKQLEDVRQTNGGAVINVIEFKSGPAAGKANFLQTLAEQNRGEYKAIDVKSFEAGR